jgi:hypothetical protein
MSFFIRKIKPRIKKTHIEHFKEMPNMCLFLSYVRNIFIILFKYSINLDGL